MAENNDAMADFAEKLDGNNAHGISADVVDLSSEQVYVDIESYGANPLCGMDNLCTMAFKHGLRPCGIISSGAVRFKPLE